MPEQERRSGERIVLSPPVEARLHDRTVRILDIGPMGIRVENTEELPVHSSQRVTFRWDGDEIAVDCLVARCDRSDGLNIFHTGLEFRLSAATEAPVRKMIESLRDREEIDHLKTLVEASKLINSSIEPDALFGSILSVARKELGVDRGTLYFVDDKKGEIWAKIAGDLEGRQIRLPIGKGIAGSVAATGEPVLLHDAYADPRFDRSLDQSSGYRTRSMLTVPIKNRSGRIVGVLQLLNKRRGSFGESDLRFLDSISDHMAIAMDNATLHLELLEKQRMERELQLGREIQGRLMPTPPSDVRNTELAAMNLPCFEVGGDYYDFLELPDGDIAVVIADVSGKGVAAALIMSSMQAALRVAAPMESDLAMLMARLNALLYRSTKGRKYVTTFLGRYTPRTGELRFVNAGHNPPMIILGTDCQKLDSTGKPIGLLPDCPFGENTAMVPPGGTLILYTDGLNEAENPQEQEFGNERLQSLLCDAARMPTTDIVSYVLTTITDFENGAHPTDDKTIVVLRRRA
ncbi:MAG: SpoIIE family protein phosphatase [Thermoanaerobaculia bacterium]